MAFKLAIEYSSPWGDGEQVFELMAKELVGALSDYSEAWQKVATDVLAPALAEQFDTEGAELRHIRWADLKPATVKRRGTAHPILHDTGALEESFQEGGGDHVEDITPDAMEWGSEIPYASYHQTGTDRMVARQPLALPPELREKIVVAMNEVIKRKLREAGFNTE